jgi:hypothetical protein
MGLGYLPVTLKIVLVYCPSLSIIRKDDEKISRDLSCHKDIIVYSNNIREYMLNISSNAEYIDEYNNCFLVRTRYIINVHTLWKMLRLVMKRLYLCETLPDL